MSTQLTSDSGSERQAGESFQTSDAQRLTFVVTAHKLTKIYDKQKAVDGIDFSVRRGETFGLLGPNGAGKSTTMRMIACRTPLTSGELSVEGLDVRTYGRKIRSLALPR